MKPALQRTVLATAILLATILALAAWWFLPSRRAEVRLAPISQTTVSRSAFAVEPFILQRDCRWATVKIGGSGESIKSVGCTLCCLSMAMGHHGIEITPPELNQKLIGVDGYTYRGWVKWDAIRQISNERVKIELPANPTHQDIETALANGDPVLVKVPLRSGIQHWVLLVGREGNEYLMKDPLGDGKNLRNLSSLGGDILAVRIVKKI